MNEDGRTLDGRACYDDVPALRFTRAVLERRCALSAGAVLSARMHGHDVIATGR